MDRKVPTCLLRLLESWLSKCVTWVKWKGVLSGCIRLTRGCGFGLRLAELSSYCRNVNELMSIGLRLNVKKSCCIRTGPRFRYDCADISTPEGERISWVSELIYIGVDIMRGRKFSCSLSKAKCKFNGAVSSVIGKLENLAHEDVLIQLIKSKCLPILLYGTEVCALNKAQLRSLNFAVVSVGSLPFRVRISSHNS
jgi:hypothetical protein